MKRCAFLLALVALLWASSALAHEASSAQLEIDALSPSDARVTASGAPGLAPEIRVPADCRLDPPPKPVGMLRCSEGLAGQTLTFARAGQAATAVDFVVVRMRGFGSADTETSVVTADARQITLPGRPLTKSVFARYVRLGVEHVASGADHVLFLVALFWQAWSTSVGRLRRTAATLARTATLFTLAHSVTLGATTLGVLHVPARVAEAGIALSLVLAALDLGRDRARARAGTGLAGLFGLVHGLGFAGALAEIRIPDGARLTALFAFNVGVELGQVLLFAGCIGVIALARRFLRRGAAHTELAADLSAYVVGIAGAAMFFTRALSIFQP